MDTIRYVSNLPSHKTCVLTVGCCDTEFATEDRKRGLRWASGGLPTFHTIGMGLQALDPLTTGQPAGMFTPQEPLPPVIPTADKVLELSRVTNSNAIISVPTFLEVSLVQPLPSCISEQHHLTDVGTIRRGDEVSCHSCDGREWRLPRFSCAILKTGPVGFWRWAALAH